MADVLNAESGFFPFQVPAGAVPDTVLINRPQLISVRLLEETTEAQRDPGYEVATVRQVEMLLSNGEMLSDTVRVYRPQGATVSAITRRQLTCSATWRMRKGRSW